MHYRRIFVRSISLLCLVAVVSASVGDHSWTFQRCVWHCLRANCTISDADYAMALPAHMRLLGWTCLNECEHGCMWRTVDAFKRDGSPVPQFFGKWPFIRVHGIQEPASVTFSIMNAIPHVIMMVKFRREVPSKAPLYYMWQMYALVSVNAWCWSTIFHSRDTNFTEMMDYFCAVSVVLSSMFVCCVRILTTKQWVKISACGAALLAFFTYHIHYLAFVKFDYGYNMKANVTVGLINSIMWLGWCYVHRKKQPYVWKAAAVILLVNLLLLLELGDFPPIWWTFDAHSLWHLGTSPLPFLWYSFTIEDCKYMLEMQEQPDVKEVTTEEEEKKFS